MTTNRVSPVELLTRDLSPSSSPVDPYEVAPEDDPRLREPVMPDYSITVPLTGAQRLAIDRQAAVYGTDDTPNCRGLHSWRAYSAAQWGDEPIGDHHVGDRVAVDFAYLYADDSDPRPGLEVAIFDRAGEVVDAQDFG